MKGIPPRADAWRAPGRLTVVRAGLVLSGGRGAVWGMESAARVGAWGSAAFVQM